MKQICKQIELDDIRHAPNFKFEESNTDDLTAQKAHMRRKIVNRLNIRGFTDHEIARQLGYSVSTIEKDLHHIRVKSKKWYNAEAVTDYCQSLNDAITLYDIALSDLRLLYGEEVKNEIKLKIIQTMLEITEKRNQMYEKTKAVKNHLHPKTPENCIGGI